MNSTFFWKFVNFTTAALIGISLARSAAAQPLEQREIAELQESLAPISAAAVGPNPATTASEPTRLQLTPQGFLRYLGAPPSHHFVLNSGLVAGQPATIARNFLRERGRLFGIKTDAVDFTVKRERQSGTRNHLRFQQVYQNLPVVAGEVIVQVDAQGGIECVLSDIETDTTQLDNGNISLTPALTAEQAAAAVKEAFTVQAAGAPVQTTTPVLSIFAPSVLDETGPQQLVWDMIVFTDNRQLVNERVLWDARGSNAVRVWTQNHTALNRQISDKNNNPTGNAIIARTEGQPATGITDVDNAYQFLGDTYNFYQSRHGRDSVDNAGATLSAVVRYCDTNNPCPWANASAGSPMSFGAGFTTDDIVAHEFTHNVTANESELIYTNASGAINESLSDIWGEFVDLTNTGGNDDPTSRWLLGEDKATGASRNMRSPTNFFHPDRLGSPLYQQPSDTSDQGGVHSNSGVNNKLCYLLTDGDTFNGQTVSGLGIDQVARLYYEAQVNLLTGGSGWAQLYDALQQASVNLGWNTADRNNLYRACMAVEIATPPAHVYVDKSIFCLVPAGNPACVANFGPYITVGQGVAGAYPGDVIHIRTGTYNEPMTINKILTLQAENGPVTIGP